MPLVAMCFRVLLSTLGILSTLLIVANVDNPMLHISSDDHDQCFAFDSQQLGPPPWVQQCHECSGQLSWSLRC